MNKKFKTMITCALTATTLLSAVGCNPDGSIQVDPTKTQLYVFNYDGGVGSAWIDKAMQDFAADFANYSFEEGKTGVQFMPEKAKTSELQTIANSQNEVLFAEIANYPSLVDSNVLLDITDIMDVSLNEYLVDENGQAVTEDTEAIIDKMYEESIDFYSYKNDTFYALPHFAVFSGITYNKALFDKKGFYFAKTPSGTEPYQQFVQVGNLEKSCGPDGQYGSSDDGLPASWEEMFLLCDYMAGRTVDPFVWLGATDGRAGYFNYLLNNIYLNLAGAEQARYNYTFDSGSKEITIVERFDENGNPVTRKEVVNSSNYGEVLNCELAKYQAIAVADRILDTTGWQSDICDTGSSSMIGTQEAFIYSYNEAERPIAMLVEGSYWYNESAQAGKIEDAITLYQEEYTENNDYQILPLPRVYEGRAADIANKTMHKTVVADQNDTVACINAKVASNPGKVKLAKMFLAYCYTAEKLAEFTEITRVTRSLKYEVNEQLSGWGKTVWDFTKNSDVVFPYSSNEHFLNNRERLSMHINNSFWNSTSTNKAYNGLKGANKKATDYFTTYMNRAWS